MTKRNLQSLRDWSWALRLIIGSAAVTGLIASLASIESNMHFVVMLVAAINFGLSVAGLRVMQLLKEEIDEIEQEANK